MIKMNVLNLLERLHELIGEAITYLKKSEYKSGDVIQYLPHKNSSYRKLGYVLQVRQVLDIYSLAYQKTIAIQSEQIKKIVRVKDDPDYEDYLRSVPLNLLEKNLSQTQSPDQLKTLITFATKPEKSMI